MEFAPELVLTNDIPNLDDLIYSLSTCNGDSPWNVDRFHNSCNYFLMDGKYPCRVIQSTRVQHEVVVSNFNSFQRSSGQRALAYVQGTSERDINLEETRESDNSNTSGLRNVL